MKGFWLKVLVIGAAVLIVLLALFWYLKPSTLQPASNILPTPTAAAVNIEKRENFERAMKLQKETDALLQLFDKMPQVPVFLKNEIINKEGSNTERGVAYTTCENKNQPTIFVKKVFYENANGKQLVNILKHELTHAWQCRQETMWGHDERFRRKFKEVGGFGN